MSIMSKFFCTALFISYATAQVTSSVWMLGGEGLGYTLHGSVMNVDDDHTTLSVSLPGMTDTIGSDVLRDQTITIAGNTYYGFNVEVVQEGVTLEIDGECARQNTDVERATCSLTTRGSEEANSICEGPDAISELCPGGTLRTSSTTTLPAGYLGMADMVITASGDSLPSASAAATVSASSATATGSEAATSGASQTTESPEEATGAAPMMTMVPALAGLGAAAAFFL